MEAIRQFTVRLPMSLFHDIENRAKVHRRTVNGEIVHILETYIDDVIKADLMEMERVRQAGLSRMPPQ